MAALINPSSQAKTASVQHLFNELVFNMNPTFNIEPNLKVRSLRQTRTADLYIISVAL